MARKPGRRPVPAVQSPQVAVPADADLTTVIPADEPPAVGAPEPLSLAVSVADVLEERRSLLVRIDSREGRHVKVSVFSGPDREHRARAGSLTLDEADIDPIVMALFVGSEGTDFLDFVIEDHTVSQATL